MSAVKQECPDEAEIQELAVILMQANRARITARPQQPPTHTASTSTDGSNLSYNFGNEDSSKGHFGWAILGDTHIPYIMRTGEKYCAVRMVEMKVLNKYLKSLHEDIYNYTCISSYYITESEGRLLNEINFKHCDHQYGREKFTCQDLIVRLIDANEFFHFLHTCYHKLLHRNSYSIDRCGFILINNESVVPYAVYNGQKYVPLFYFEGETDKLKLKASKLEGWDLSYLKFCCKVQGIKNELLVHDSCVVISLHDIKSYYRPGTPFEDFWPSKDSQLLVNRKCPTRIGRWTRQPTVLLNPIIDVSCLNSSSNPAMQTIVANQLQNVQKIHPTFESAREQLPYHVPQTTSHQVLPSYYMNMTPATTPLVYSSLVYSSCQD